MRFEQALRIQRGDVVAFIGAGGKTSALFCLGRELSGLGWRVLATTTTRIAAHELALAPLAIQGGGDPIAVKEGLDRHGFVFLYDRIQNDKALGLDAAVIQHLLDRVDSDVVLVEADGARRLSFKAPYVHEPVIPAETTQAVLCAGMDILGRPLDKEHVYNADAIIRRYGYPSGMPVLWPWVASVLRDEHLGLLNVPAGLPVTVLLNKTPAQGLSLRRARLTASLLLGSPRIQSIVLGEVQRQENPVHEVRRPICAVVLAAGLSSRMGQPKILLPWGRETVLEAIIHRLQVARVDHIIVVTGRGAEAVRAVANRYGAEVVHNPDYEQGEMLSSLQAALRVLNNSRYDGALVVLGDQPQMQSYVISRVLDAYAEGQKGIVIPSYMMRRGHPVLFSRRFWPALLDLPAGSSPRDLVNRLPDEIVYVEVTTDSILQDIDTPEDYQAALRRAGLS